MGKIRKVKYQVDSPVNFSSREGEQAKAKATSGSGTCDVGW